MTRLRAVEKWSSSSSSDSVCRSTVLLGQRDGNVMYADAQLKGLAFIAMVFGELSIAYSCRNTY
jgi:hypothetical protein